MMTNVRTHDHDFIVARNGQRVYGLGRYDRRTAVDFRPIPADDSHFERPTENDEG